MTNRSKGSVKGWVTRSTTKEVVARERALDEKKRSERAIAQDRKKTAKRVYSPSDPEEVVKWRENKGRSDLAGVDTVFRKLTRIKKKVSKRVKVSKKRQKAIVEKTKEKVKKIAKDPEKPKEVKDRQVKQTIAEGERELKKEQETTEKVIEQAKEEQAKEIRVHEARWTPERRRRAEYVAETTGCSVLEADALIQRARRAGYDYDKVDWDRVQGKDLSYHERVGKLEEAIGRDTQTVAEQRMAAKNVDWVIEEYEKDEESWKMEMQGAMRDLANEYYAGNL